MAIIDELKAVMTLDTSGFNAAAVNSSLQGMKAGFDTLGASVQTFTQQSQAGMKTFADAAGRLRDEFGRFVSSGKQAGDSVKAVGDSATGAMPPIKTFTDSAGRLRDEFGKFVGSGKQAGDSVKGVGDSATGATPPIRNFSKALQDAGASMQKFGQELSQAGTQLAIGLTAPLVAFGGASIKMSSDFELGLRQVTSLLGQTSEQADKTFGQMSAGVLELSKRLGVDATGATKALYEAVSAGISQENALTFLDTASKAAIAGVTNTKVAVDGLTTVINAYQLEASRAGEVSDAMFQAVNIGKVTFEQLSASIGQAAPLAAQMGVGFKELLAAMASITKQGVTGSEAFTQISSALRAMIDPSDKMKELFAKMGVESGKALIASKGFEGGLRAIREAAGGSEQALSAAFGRIEGLRAILSLTGKNAATAAADLRGLENSVGATDKAMREIDKTVARQFEILAANVKAAAIEFGAALAPAVASNISKLGELVKLLNEAVDGFSKLTPATKEFALNLGLILASLAPLAFGLGKIIEVGGIITATFGRMVAALRAASLAIAAGGLIGGLTLLGGSLVAISIAAAGLIGWQLGKWAYDQVPGFKALGEALFKWFDPFVQMIARITSGQMTTAEMERAVGKLETALKSVGVTVERGNMTVEQYSRALRTAAIDAGVMTISLEKVAAGLRSLLANEFEPQVLQQGADESMGRYVERLKQAAQSVGLLANQFDKLSKVPPPPDLKPTAEQIEAVVKAAGLLVAAESWKQMADNVGRASGSVEMLTDRVDMLQAVLGARGIAPNLLEQGVGESLQDYANRLQNLVNVFNSHKAGIEQTLAVNKQLADDWRKLTGDAQKLEDGIKKIRTEDFVKRLNEMRVSVAEVAAAIRDASQISRFGPVLADTTPARKAVEDLRTKIVATIDELYKSRGEIPMVADLKDVDRAMRELIPIGMEIELPFTNLRVTVQALASDFIVAGRATADMIEAGQRAARGFGFETIQQQLERLKATENALAVARTASANAATRGGLENIDILRLQQQVLIQQLSIWRELGQQDTPAFRQAAKDLEEVNRQLGPIDAGLQRIRDSATEWGKTSKRVMQEVSTAWTDFSRSLADIVFGIFKDPNKDLQKQVNDLRRSMDERAQEWADYQAEASEKIEQITVKHATELAKEEADLARSMQDRAREYDKQVAGIIAGLDKQRREYVTFVADTNRKLGELGNRYGAQLADELEKLRANLRERADSYQQFVQQSNRTLARIGEDLGETLAGQTADANRSIEDLNRDHARTVEDLQRQLREAQKAGDQDRVREIQRQLQQSEEDYQVSLRRIQQTLEEQTADARKQATRQTEDLQSELRMRAEEYTKFQADVAAQIEATTRKNREAESEERAALEAGLADRRRQMTEFEAETSAKLAEARADYDQFVTDSMTKLSELRARHAEELARELADVQESLDKQRQAYEKFVADSTARLMELEEQFKGTWDRIAEAGIKAFEALGKAIFRIMIEGALDPLKKYIAGLLDDVLGLTKVIMGSAATTAAGAIPGEDFGGIFRGGGPKPTAPSVPGAGGATSGAGGLLGTIGNIANIAGAIVGAITDVWSLTVQRRMEQDIGRIEVTTRGMLNQFISIQERLNQIGADVIDIAKAAVDPKFWMVVYEKLDTIIAWLTSGGGGARQAGGTTPGTPAPFPGGADQGPANAAAVEATTSIAAADAPLLREVMRRLSVGDAAGEQSTKILKDTQVELQRQHDAVVSLIASASPSFINTLLNTRLLGNLAIWFDQTWTRLEQIIQGTTEISDILQKGGFGSTQESAVAPSSSTGGTNPSVDIAEGIAQEFAESLQAIERELVAAGAMLTESATASGVAIRGVAESLQAIRAAADASVQAISEIPESVIEAMDVLIGEFTGLVADFGNVLPGPQYSEFYRPHYEYRDRTGDIARAVNASPLRPGGDFPNYGNEPTRPLAPGQPLGLAPTEAWADLIRRFPELTIPGSEYFEQWRRNSEEMGLAFEAATVDGQRFRSSMTEMTTAIQGATQAAQDFTTVLRGGALPIPTAPRTQGNLANDVILNRVGLTTTPPVTLNVEIHGDLATEAQRRQVARELAQYVDEYRQVVRLT